MEWRLRRAGIGDLEAVMRLERDTFPSDAWSPRTMVRELGDPAGHYLVAEGGNGAVEGYAGVLAPVGAEDADIQTVAVAEGARRRGLGRALVSALLAEAARRGAVRVFLEVRADNEGAQRLYRALGFEQIGVRRGYYQPDDVDAVVMRRGMAEAGERA